MKKFLSLALLVVLVTSVLVVASSATTTSTYWAIDSNCLVKARTLDDGYVPTFKSCEGNLDGLLVGLPTEATYDSDNGYFQPKTSAYSIKYFDKNGKKITVDGTHIGTNDKVVVYDSNNNIVAEYGIVTYGDADGDGVFDVIDAFVAGLCLNGFIAETEDPAVYESVKPRIDYDNTSVDILDYQQIVNDVVSDAGDLKENLKGRKIPVDDTINFESVMYACDGQKKAAAVNIPDSTFKENVEIEIKYNGQKDVPSAPGIYSVTAEVPSNTDYLVTPGERELGFIVIAPKTGDGYATIVDNVNKKITIDVTKPNATGADLTGYINSWINSEYKLSVSSKNIASASDLAAALGLRSYKHYVTNTSRVVTISEKTIISTAVTTNAALGCYLPDDYTLWANNFAEKTIPVSVTNDSKNFGYTICFRQSADKVKALDKELLMYKSAQGRGQRKTNPPESKGVPNSLVSFITDKEVFCFTKYKPNSSTGAYEKTIRTAVSSKGSHPLLLTSLGGTGLKSLLLGPNDAICFVAASSKTALPAITESNSNILYDTGNGNTRFEKYGSDDLKDSALKNRFMDLMNNVLSGFGDVKVNELSTTNALIGESGWCRYGCADDSTGIRYTSDYYIEFTNVDNTQDAHRLLTVVPVDGCTITTNPTQGTSGSGSNAYSPCERMTQYETFTVSATLKAGYKLSVTDASGNAVPYDAEYGWYIMPASNVTVTAVPQ